MADTVRSVPEDLAAIAAYLQVVSHTLKQSVYPAISADAAKVRNDLDEVEIILRRIMWHFEAVDDAARAATLADCIVADEIAYQSKTVTIPPATPRGDIDPDQLQTILRETLPGAEQINVTSLKLVAGGRSKLTALFDQSGAADLPEKLVLRQDWASAVTGTSVAAEYELLSKLAPLGIRAPRCLHYVPGPNAIGAAFMIVTRLAGAPKGDIFQPPALPKLALQLADQLGALHACPTDRFTGISTLVERDYTINQLSTTLAELRKTHDALGQGLPTLHRAFEWLERQLPAVRGTKGLVHGDLGFHNFLVDGDDLTAILDWELAHFGNPAEDLGYIRGDIEHMLPWAEFIAAYENAGGPHVREIDVDFYFVWGLTRLYCMLMQARAGLTAGIVQDIAVVRVCVDSVPRLVATLENGLARITSRSMAVVA